MGDITDQPLARSRSARSPRLLHALQQEPLLEEGLCWELRPQHLDSQGSYQARSCPRPLISMGTMGEPGWGWDVSPELITAYLGEPCLGPRRWGEGQHLPCQEKCGDSPEGWALGPAWGGARGQMLASVTLVLEISS